MPGTYAGAPPAGYTGGPPASLQPGGVRSICVNVMGTKSHTPTETLPSIPRLRCSSASRIGKLFLLVYFHLCFCSFSTLCFCFVYFPLNPTTPDPRIRQPCHGPISLNILPTAAHLHNPTISHTAPRLPQCPLLAIREHPRTSWTTACSLPRSAAAGLFTPAAPTT